MEWNGCPLSWLKGTLKLITFNYKSCFSELALSPPSRTYTTSRLLTSHTHTHKNSLTLSVYSTLLFTLLACFRKHRRYTNKQTQIHTVTNFLDVYLSVFVYSLVLICGKRIRWNFCNKTNKKFYWITKNNHRHNQHRYNIRSGSRNQVDNVVKRYKRFLKLDFRSDKFFQLLKVLSSFLFWFSHFIRFISS